MPNLSSNAGHGRKADIWRAAEATLDVHSEQLCLWNW
jgi:hypothetical protein